ncbi:hypothetical protein [Absidia glauca]|uniref:Uncharacterized protein n=1 Tax=Absidia glauca TaxID=4829 RepID=A0A168NZJ9_ABSGL|nr:hypothetical protein [Absidia glauca]
MPFTKSSSSSSSTCSSSSFSASSSSSLRDFLNHMVHSILHPFAPPTSTQPTTQVRSAPKDLLTLQHAMNASLSLFEKTYVSFPEFSDHDGNNVQHAPPSSSITC